MLNTLYKHERLTEILRKEINKKEFPDSRFYTMKYLMDHFNVSQSTLNRALQPLFQEGLLYSVSGKGTFVASETKLVSTDKADLKNLYCVISDTEMFSKESNPANWFVMREIIQGIVTEGKNNGFHVNLCPLNDDIKVFKKLSSQANSMFIFTEYERYEQLIEYCHKEKIPYSVYARHEEIQRNINQVWVDIRDGIYKATKYLIEKGHKEIAFLGDFKGSLRHQGYKRALKEAGIRRRQNYCFYDMDGQVDKAQEIGERVLKEIPEVTAIVCSSDLRAVGVLNAVIQAGYDISKFSITGFDNINDFYPVPMPLTTVDFPRKYIGRELVKIADDFKINGNTSKLKIETQIVPGITA